ncbi:MAG: adhesin, partial [Bacteroidia bacterium]
MKKTILPLFLLLSCAGALLGQVKLPFKESFENIGTTTTFNSNTTSINGLSEWSYQKSSRGRIRFKAGNGFYKTGSAAATFDVERNNNTSTNYLILTLDLSNYTSSELELAFSYMHHGEESNNTDRIWVRGSSSDSWVEIYNWYSNRANSGTWKNVEGLDIDKTLSGASQTVSSTFQLRIGQTDNFIARSTTRDDGVTFDDIEIKA